MNFIISFWGLLAERIDFWGVWREVVNSPVVDEVAWVVNQINSAGYEVPLRAVAQALAYKTGVESRVLAQLFIERVKARIKPAQCLGEFYSWLRERGKIAVLSNTPCKCFIEDFLREYKISVDLILTSDVLLKRKPLKQVFKYALSKLGAQPQNTILFGDGVEDLGALGLGIFTITIGVEGGHLSFPSLCHAAKWLATEFKD